MKAADSISYIIGIDLGTTNSAVSYVDLNGKDPRQIHLFQIPQLTGPGEIGRENVLPSFLYIPGDYDISSEAVVHPYPSSERSFAGTFARDHGSKVPSRLVSSAKSWLCHHQADRKAKILPWGSTSEVSKVSPVAASASYLSHIRKSWNASKKDDESLWMENQMVVITVPASFDEVARELTVEASKIAGFKSITLIEEPLAAFYSWLSLHENDWMTHVCPGDLILVCDIGGGTTDFSLITLRATEGTPRFERLAVGDHLILGGDNIDLALARHIEKNFPQSSGPLSADRWKNLCHQCRRAKETILDGKSDSEKIILMGQGSRLIGGAISGDLTRSAIEGILLNGFFPIVLPDETFSRKERKGISEFGLPYEQEPSMTKHLCMFLDHHRKDIEQKISKSSFPSHVLFNGGSLKPEIITERIRDSLRCWFGESNHSLPYVLENKNPDLAVAIGAAYYGMVKQGKGVRVGSGSPRSYYLGIDPIASDSEPEAVCLVERGLDEGSHFELKDLDLLVITNRLVKFKLYSSSFRTGDKISDIVRIDETFTGLPDLNTVISYGKKQTERNVPVHLVVDYTEMGTLDIQCRSLESDHSWKLSFSLRTDNTSIDLQDSEIMDETILSCAADVISDAFSSMDRNKTENTRILDRKSTRLNSSHRLTSRMPSSA
jgi:molecular chaperone DnaK (HSP70)